MKYNPYTLLFDETCPPGKAVKLALSSKFTSHRSCYTIGDELDIFVQQRQWQNPVSINWLTLLFECKEFSEKKTLLKLDYDDNKKWLISENVTLNCHEAGVTRPRM